jgi:hypothetical protein
VILIIAIASLVVVLLPAIYAKREVAFQE